MAKTRASPQKGMEHLTDPEKIETAQLSIAEYLATRGEWLCTQHAHDGANFGSHPASSKTFATHRSACEARVRHGSLFISLWTETGEIVWRVSAWEVSGDKLRLEVSRRLKAECAVLEFVPRACVRAALADVREARRARCLQLANIARETLAREMRTYAHIERAALSAGARRNEPGRFARVLLRNGETRTAKKFIAATGAVIELKAGEMEAFLASALLWVDRLRERFESRKSRAEVGALWLIVKKDLAETIAARVALLRASVRRQISICALDEETGTIAFVRAPKLDELCESKIAPRLVRTSRVDFSDTALRLRKLAPEAIDIARARHGETLRFHGLPFARVRRVAGSEKVWFGVSASKKVLDENNWRELVKLLDDLKEYRRPNPNMKEADTNAKEFDEYDFGAPAHALYLSAPEAWLETILRRDITQLDPGLRLAPLHAQFRAGVEARRGARPVDLLALRRDGRLVVIELKVSEDVTLPLQGADYWRRIELQRRAGNIARARIFDDAKILDAPPLVYLVAPFLRFHRQFEMLAKLISPEIEIYRFEINENWRAGVRVVRRERVN